MTNNIEMLPEEEQFLLEGAKKGIYLGARVLGGAGACLIVALALFTTVGAVMRYFFSRPILGDLEITEFVLAMVVACVLPYTQYKKGHIVLDLVMSHFSERTQTVIGNVLYFFAAVLTAFITWQTALQAMAQYRNDLVSASLAIPVYPFVIITAIGWGLLCLVFWVEFLETLMRK